MIELKNIYKKFGTDENVVLQDINAVIHDSEFVALLGKSGSGKSTLMYIMSTLDTPSSGQLLLNGNLIQAMNQKALHQFRNQHIGFVFQFHYLLPELTSLENVLMPTLKTNQMAKRKDLAITLLKEVGLSDKLHRLPRQLSGGEQQRVAIARALIMDPTYLFADEPTGNLDTTNGDIVMALLKRFNKENKTTIIMVTHDPDFAMQASRQIHLTDGRVD